MQAWDQFLVRLEGKLGAETVEKWVRSLRVLHFDAVNLYLEAGDSFQIDWFEEHVRPHLQGNLLNNNERPIQVHLSLPIVTPAEKVDAKQESFAITPNGLNPEMTFENFLVSEQNKIALEILREGEFNPVFLYGAKGSGKTHLLMSCALEMEKRGKRVFYVRAETFTEHVVQAIRLGFMQDFRRAYREIDVLLVDDIHIFSRKNATQEEFFHTFNALHTAGKQIFLTSNVPPSKLNEIEPRLISRFEWGISIPLEVHEMKGLLQKKAALWGVTLSEELVNYLLQKFPREPLLALQALVLRGKSEVITPLLVERLLGDLLEKEQTDALTSEKIIKTIAGHYAIKGEDLLGKSQMREYAFPRKVAMYLCREKLKLPFQKIGELFGRDHSTVMTSIRQIEKEVEKKNSDVLEALSKV